MAGGTLTKNLRWMTWAGLVGLVVLLIGQWGIAKFVPPPGPHKSVGEIVSIYTHDQDRIRIGLVIALFGVTGLGPWVTALAIRMKDIEGARSPLAWLQVMLGACLLLEFFVPVMIWQAAAFRPGLDPVITYRLHDVGSIVYDGIPVTGALQAFILGIAILQDDDGAGVFPRWLAYVSFWAGLGFLPGALNPLFHSGPLAWSGIIAWWLGLSIFGVWIGAVSWCMLKR